MIARRTKPGLKRISLASELVYVNGSNLEDSNSAQHVIKPRYMGSNGVALD